MQNVIDHVTIGAASLDQGVAFLRAGFGVEIPRGGKHPDMGTYNCVARTVPGEFLEVIAIDPDAPPPAGPRWFGLDVQARRDQLARQPAPVGWVVRTSDIRAVQAASPVELGPARSMSRGVLSWQLTVPRSGLSALDGLVPSFIQWDGEPHPSYNMAPSGLQLEMVILRHPRPDDVLRCLVALSIERLARVESSDAPSLAFIFRLPDGRTCQVS